MTESAPGFILASASSRRLELLAQIGLQPIAVVSPDVDESPLAKETAQACVLRLAQAKARAIAARYPDTVILAADTLLGMDEMIIGKPSGRDEAMKIWERLSGRRHHVLSAVAVCRNSDCRVELNTSEVEFAPLETQAMERYWQSGEPADKAGGYAIQGKAAIWIKTINGSYSGIMGLPLFETSRLLANFGVGNVQ